MTKPDSAADRRRVTNRADEGTLRVDPFIGRGDELRTLERGLDEVVAGRLACHFITGEAGIGKTRLCDEIAERARRRGMTVARGRCWGGGGAPPYYPWRELFRGLRRARQFPQKRMGTADSAMRDPVSAEMARTELFEAATRVLRRAAARTPLLLVIDDLQWADVTSILLLRFLVRSSSSAPIAVVGTVRVDGEPMDPAIAANLADLYREGRSLELRGFDASETWQLVAELTGTSPAKSTVERLLRATAGNPFFLHEVVAELPRVSGTDHGRVTTAGVPVPATVRQAIEKHLSRVSRRARAFLEVGAVLGSEFQADLAASLAGLDAAARGAALEEALAVRLLDQGSGRVGVYRFAHGLLRAVLYDALPLARRARLHQATAEALERRGPGAGGSLAELANHWYQAIPAAGVQRAIETATQAAAQALAELAYEDAVALLKRALLLLAEAPDEVMLCEVLLALGDASARLGDSDLANDAFRRAFDVARRLGRPDAVVRAALGAAYDFGWGGFGRVDDSLVTLLREALDAFGEGDSRERSVLLSRLAIAVYWSSDVESPNRLSAEALRMAERLADPVALAEAWGCRHQVLFGPDHSLAERAESGLELERIAVRTGNAELRVRALNLRVADALEAGDASEFDRRSRDFTEAADKIRQAFYRWQSAYLAALRAGLAGRFDECLDRAGKALEIGAPVHQENALQTFGAQTLIHVHVPRGTLASIEPMVAELIETSPGIPGWRAVHAFVLARLGRLDEARGAFERLAVRGFAELPRDALWLPSTWFLAQTAAALSDGARAAILHAQLLPHRRSNAVVGPAIACPGPVAHALALVAWTAGEHAAARAYFEEALTRAFAMSATPWLVDIRLDYGRFLLESGAGDQVARARKMIGDARHVAESLGMETALRAATELDDDAAGRIVKPSHGRTASDDGSLPFDRNVFRRDGDFWTLGYESKVVRVKDSKGMGDLACLLASPRKMIHVTELIAAAVSSDDPRAAALRGRSAHELAELGLSVATESRDPALDVRAMREYRKRLAELRAEVDAGERRGDPDTLRAREEIARIEGELAAAFAAGRHLSGKSVERARSALTMRIRKVLARIEKLHPALGRHLSRSIRTGVFCSYSPEAEIDWTF